MKVKVKRMGINGEGIAYLNKKAIFVDGAINGEVCDIEITQEEKYYSKAKIKEIIVESNNRVEPICPVYHKCGGCNLMHCSYDYQLEIKRQILKESLSKYCGYQGNIEPTVKSSKDLCYRNKCNIPFLDNKGKLDNGLYQPESNIFQTIDKCYLHSTKLEKLRKDILGVLNQNNCKLYNQKDKKGFRQLIIRGFNNSFQVVLVTGNDEIETNVIEQLAKLDNLSSLYQGVNVMKNPVNLMPDELTLLFGSSYISFELDKYQFQLLPNAFFQLNQYTAANIYNTVKDLIKGKQKLIFEAYCGIGAISMYLSEKAERVIGIDLDASAIKSAKLNCKLNNIDNVSFKLGDATSQLKSIISKNKVDTLVVDPPRKGIDEQLLEALSTSNIDNIIYISCNPATLAKNIKVLSKQYRIKRVVPFDMFPQTSHVETITLLQKN
ncbi:MAG: 23S rRNA (uracil(1939)-C(5))-methyltransferase RlmD [Erysipelotrichaceae bacterium]